MILGSNAEVTWPKLVSALVASMPLNCVWFQVLKVSKRSSNLLPRDSLIVKFLNSERFQLSRPGLRRALCPSVPQAPGAGSAKLVVANQIGLPDAGLEVPPLT